MSSIVYYVLDVETNGLRVSYHEITEIGIIRVSDRVQIHRNVKCLYPERSSFDALNITRKTLADLERGYNREEVIKDCEKFFNQDGLTPAHRCIIGHNVSFDRKFLHALWGESGKEFPAHLWLDTIALTRDYAKKNGIIKPKVNLHAACDLLGVKKISEAHDAKNDSRNTYLLHKALVEDKKIDFLPFIKTAVHSINEKEDIDLSILEEDV